MKPSEHDRLILRRENFGGIVFNPITATHLDLDKEGYERACEFLARGSVADRGYALAFEKKLLASLGELPSHPPRVVESSQIAVSGFRVLAAPTLVDMQITSVCTQGCPHCYASSVYRGEHMPFGDMCRIFDDCAKAGVLQIALGGGDPLLHPNFVDAIRAVRERGMVPNVTTSGAYFTDENLQALRKYCGAVALSLEGVGRRYSARRALGWKGFLAALSRLQENDIHTVLQVTVGSSNLETVPDIVKFALTQKLYGVIFLAYKPVGRGESFDKPLSACEPNRVAEILAGAFRELAVHTRVGYDCCSSAIVAGMNESVFGHNNSELEGCSALRGSVGISVQQKFLPCTFTEQLECGDLKSHTLVELWHGQGAQAFREKQEASVKANAVCSGCSYSQQCMGGCPVYDLGRCSFYPVTSVSLPDLPRRAKMPDTLRGF